MRFSFKKPIRSAITVVAFSTLAACGGGGGPTDYWEGSWSYYYRTTGTWADALDSKKVPNGPIGQYATEAECKVAPISKTPPSGAWPNLSYSCAHVVSK